MPKFNDFELDLQRITVNTLSSFPSGRDSTEEMGVEISLSIGSRCTACEPKEPVSGGASHDYLTNSARLP